MKSFVGGIRKSLHDVTLLTKGQKTLDPESRNPRKVAWIRKISGFANGNKEVEISTFDDNKG